MSSWLIVVLVIISMILGFMLGSAWSKDSPIKTNGLIFVDKEEHTVWLEAFSDPQDYVDGQKLMLEVCWFTEEMRKARESQAKQGLE